MILTRLNKNNSCLQAALITSTHNKYLHVDGILLHHLFELMFDTEPYSH